MPLAAAAAAGRWGLLARSLSPAEELKVRAGPGWGEGKAAPRAGGRGAAPVSDAGLCGRFLGQNGLGNPPGEAPLLALRAAEAQAAPEAGGGLVTGWLGVGPHAGSARPPGSAPALAAARAGGEAWDPPRKPCPLGPGSLGRRRPTRRCCDGGGGGGAPSSTSPAPGAGDGAAAAGRRGQGAERIPDG